MSYVETKTCIKLPNDCNHEMFIKCVSCFSPNALHWLKCIAAYLLVFLMRNRMNANNSVWSSSASHCWCYHLALALQQCLAGLGHTAGQGRGGSALQVAQSSRQSPSCIACPCNHPALENAHLQSAAVPRQLQSIPAA